MSNWQDWPEVQGHVESVTWNADLYPDYTPYATVAYSYVVSSERYGGNVEKEFQTDEEAAEFVNQLRDHEVTVRYRPDKPGQSVVPSLL